AADRLLRRPAGVDPSRAGRGSDPRIRREPERGHLQRRAGSTQYRSSRPATQAEGRRGHRERRRALAGPICRHSTPHRGLGGTCMAPFTYTHTYTRAEAVVDQVDVLLREAGIDEFRCLKVCNAVAERWLDAVGLYIERESRRIYEIEASISWTRLADQAELSF